MFNSFRRNLKTAGQIYKSGGMIIAIRRISGYFWKESVFFIAKSMSRDGFIKKKVYGNTMFLNVHDTGIAKELTVYGIHEPLTTQLIRQEIKPGMTVVDIGANIGFLTLQFAQLVGENGKVIAIEPVLDNINSLNKNIEVNGYRNIQVYHAAIGAKDGTAKIYLSHTSNICSLIPQDYHYGQSEVEIYRLDTLLEKVNKIDYLKMDVEGYETEVIKGMPKILKNHKPGIFVETHSPRTGGQAMILFLETLMSFGYETKYVVDKAFNYPTVNWKNGIEHIPLNMLINDKRISQGQAAITLLLEAK